MKNLPNVTLLGIDCIDCDRLIRAIDLCSEQICFGQTKILTSLPTNDPRAVVIPAINSVAEYSLFCIRDLHRYVETPFVLLVQYDGFILNPGAWNDEFFNYDYIGAPCRVIGPGTFGWSYFLRHCGEFFVGNGGFSLRSKKLLVATAQLFRANESKRINPEDAYICCWNKDTLQQSGLRFAPARIAAFFSIEYGRHLNEFGFHSFRLTNISRWIQAHPRYDWIRQQYRAAKHKNHYEYYKITLQLAVVRVCLFIRGLLRMKTGNYTE